MIVERAITIYGVNVQILSQYWKIKKKYYSNCCGRSVSWLAPRPLWKGAPCLGLTEKICGVVILGIYAIEKIRAKITMNEIRLEIVRIWKRPIFYVLFFNTFFSLRIRGRWWRASFNDSMLKFFKKKNVIKTSFLDQNNCLIFCVPIVNSLRLFFNSKDVWKCVI